GLIPAALSYISAQMQHVLVLNASYEPLNVTTVRRAHVLVFKGKAEVIEELDQPLRSATDTFPWPHVIRLVAYVHVPRAAQRKISRRALFARDGWRCAYCGTSGGRLTLDHVVPRSRGGESIWENVVTSCAPCNLRKGNRRPAAYEERNEGARRDPRCRAPRRRARRRGERRLGRGVQPRRPRDHGHRLRDRLLDADPRGVRLRRDERREDGVGGARRERVRH